MSGPSQKIVVGTHSGRFHADEALAVALLRRHPTVGPRLSPVVKRSRDPAVWATCDILVDVGGTYEPAKGRFDHHQGSFTDTFSSEHMATAMSSAGLVYKHYGRDIVSSAVCDKQCADLIYGKMYDRFVEVFDAVDNGVERFDRSAQEPRYAAPYDIFAMVGDLNPEWDEPLSETEIDAKFEQAVHLVGSAFDTKLDYYAKSWLKARKVVRQSIADSLANKELPGGCLLLKNPCPWKEHLFELENDFSAHFFYCLYNDGAGWRIQAVPKNCDTFETRRSLPEAWRGARDAELDVLLASEDLKGAVFVHKTGFIGGHREWQGILLMARRAVQG